MKRHIHIGSSDKPGRPNLADYLDRLVKRSPLSGHHKRWRILQRLACDPGQQKN